MSVSNPLSSPCPISGSIGMFKANLKRKWHIITIEISIERYPNNSEYFVVDNFLVSYNPLTIADVTWLLAIFFYTCCYACTCVRTSVSWYIIRRTQIPIVFALTWNNLITVNNNSPYNHNGYYYKENKLTLFQKYIPLGVVADSQALYDHFLSGCVELSFKSEHADVSGFLT